MVDALHHLVADLLTNLDTGIVGSSLLVVTGVGTFVQTFDKLIHVGCVDTHTLYKILFQTLSLCHTDGIAHRIDVALQVGPGSTVTASCESGGNNSHDGYDS